MIFRTTLLFLMCSQISLASPPDPIAERQARNAQLEKVSPVLDREIAYVATPQEQLSENILELQKLLTSINDALGDLTIAGSRIPQAKMLLNMNESSRDTLLALLESEAERLADSEVSSIPSAVPIETNLESEKVAVVAPVEKSSNDVYEEVVPIVVREYQEPNRSTKVILKIGVNEPAVYYVGDTFEANQTRYTIVSAKPVSVSSAPHARPVYAIALRATNGDSKIINWE